jgi:peptide deformylase
VIREILTQDDEFNVLRKPCVSVERFDEELRTLVRDMWDSMYAARGVGLAATQIGSSMRVAVIDTIQGENSHRRLVLVNPRIISSEGEQTGEEGCLSMPGLRWPITRAQSVLVEYEDINGICRRLRGRDLLARAIQHECDHLDGVLCNSKAMEAANSAPEPEKEREGK